MLLELFESYGVKEGIQMCKGMFGIALYDCQEKSISFIRDRIGEKPLYYGLVKRDGQPKEKAFAFASDLGSIAVLDGFSNYINKGVLPIR